MRVLLQKYRVVDSAQVIADLLVKSLRVLIVVVDKKAQRFGPPKKHAGELRHAAASVALAAHFRIYPDTFNATGRRRFGHHLCFKN